jgi:hypothetical protein
MRYWLDTEFIEDGHTIDLISIGIVAEDGRELYAENMECDLRMCRNEAMIHELRAEVERLRVRQIHLCSELARLALDYVTTQDEAHAELDEQQLAAEMIAFADSL